MRYGGVFALAGVFVAGFAARASAGSALDRPAFAATPAELLAEAKAAARSKADADVLVLRDETWLAFDDAGRGERRRRIVFVVEKQQAVDDRGTIAIDFRPFYQDRPAIRARVVSANGQVAELDASLVTDAPTISESPNVFSDRRKMSAPLPRLAVGAVVEEVVTTKDREPLLAAGTVAFVFVGHDVPVVRTLVTISAPAARSARVVTRGFAKTPVAKHAVRDGRATWTFDLASMEPLLPEEAGVPGDIMQRPMIAIATGRDWVAIAADYRKLVEQRIAQGPVVAPAELKGTNQAETLRKTAAWLHAHVRYTGIELSEAAIVPWPPSETLKRGFGDCKDKATLLVALLRAAGIEGGPGAAVGGTGARCRSRAAGHGRLRPRDRARKDRWTRRLGGRDRSEAAAGATSVARPRPTRADHRSGNARPLADPDVRGRRQQAPRGEDVPRARARLVDRDGGDRGERRVLGWPARLDRAQRPRPRHEGSDEVRGGHVRRRARELQRRRPARYHATREVHRHDQEGAPGLYVSRPDRRVLLPERRADAPAELAR
jgi:hypothetical protein